jgi:hypothetical protein
MKRIIILVLLVASSFYCIAQTKPSYVYKVDIDYVSGMIKLDTTTNGRIKDLKVGQILQVSILNLPSTYKVSGETVFENDKMEGSSIFNGLINKGLEDKKDDNSGTTPKSDSINTKNALKDIINSNSKNTISQNNFPSKEYKDNGTNDIEISNARKYRTNIDSIKYALANWNTINFLNDLKKNLTTNEKEALNMKSKYSSLEDAIIDLKEQRRLIEYAQENINDLKNRKDNLIKKYAAISDTIRAKTIISSITKNLIGVQVINRDYSNVKIEIKDSQNRIVNIIPLSFNNRNGFKLDFSTGFFNIFQKITTYEKLNATSFQNGINTTVDSVFEIKELNKGTNNLSIGILAHGYCRSRSYISPGAAFGFSYTLETKQLNILAGGSLLLGKEQRFILNAGIAFSKVKELTLYKVGVPYDKSFLNNTTDLKLSEKMKGSLFVGITYNLGTLKTRTETRILN